MRRAVLDTSVLIADHIELEPEVTLAISAASVAELQFGVLMAGDDTSRARRLTRLSAVQQYFPEPLAFDTGIAGIWADLAAQTKRAGRQPRRRYFDLVIAATAIAHEAALITANAADLDHLDSVDLVAV